MIVNSAAWDNYIAALRKVNNTASEKMAAYLKSHDLTTKPGLYDALDYAFALATKYGEAAAELACQMYDALGLAEGMTLAPAVPAETATYSEVAETVRGTMKYSSDTEVVASSVGRLVKLAGVDTTMQNALRDGAEWAWIPHGETCAFCIMLASNGWQRASKKAIKGGHAEHIHANCDCTYAIRFNPTTEVEGYNDGAEYREIYDNAEGRGMQKLNSMRREFYARNREVINAQKRDAYEKRKEREAPAAEELDV